jgi:DNA recombination protein RmuC
LIGILLFKIFGKAANQTENSNFQELIDEFLKLSSDEFAQNREELNKNFSCSRQETFQYFGNQQELIKNYFTEFIRHLQELQSRQQTFFLSLKETNEQISKLLTETLQRYGDRNDQKIKELVEMLDGKILQFKSAVLEENRNARQEQLTFQNKFQESVNQQLVQSRENVDTRLKEIQENNTKKLDEMKKTVDDKLQESMEKHFNESFKLISERLEQVHKGLGEMQTLAVGVGDLRKALTNVKVRGNIGEIQLATLLEQYLSPEQYEKNKSIVPNSSELVEFAIRLPGHKGEEPVFLPVDSKFPVEDYLRLMECYEQNGSMSNEVKSAQKSFAQTVKKCASDIKEKYIYPPISTAFALMFVPSEGIYAEILRQPGLFESLQNDFQISVVGPSNLVAFLNSLQMGFKTLAIEKHSNDVWQILGAVKSEFSKFGAAMDATRKSLESVVKHVDKIGVRSRAVERKLRSVHELTEEESSKYFPSDELVNAEDVLESTTDNE